MKTLVMLISFVGVSAWGAVSTPKRTLKELFAKVGNSRLTLRIEEQDPVLKDYNLIVKSATWWTGSQQAENMWEGLASSRMRELNVIVVYDSPNQDVAKLKSKVANSQMYLFFDQNREFYYWFPNNTLMDAVLIGPKGDILFDGPLNSSEQIEKVKSLVPKKTLN
jgi:hypothetical protein